MKINARLAGLFATGSLIIVAAAFAPVQAAPDQIASVRTEAFIANARPNIDFLDRSSRLAIDHSASKAIRAFAHSEAREQTTTANSLVAWTQANTTRGAIGAVAVDGTFVPETVGVATAPVVVATDVASGRSVAVDVPVAVNTVPEDTRELLPAGDTDLARLGRMRGRAFDALYRSTQTDALRQLATIYAAYIQNGDDPGLRTWAMGELPKVNARLAQIRGL